MSFETIQTKTIYRGRVFNLRQDQIRLPSGAISQLDIVEHPGAVVLLPIDQEDRIWFIRQYRHPAGEVLLELPAGTMEADEPAENCARREIREEIGMSAGQLHKIGEFFLAPGYSTEILYLYTARDLKPDPLQGDEDEIIEVEAIPAGQAFALADSGQIRDAKTLAALLLARSQLNFPE